MVGQPPLQPVRPALPVLAPVADVARDTALGARLHDRVAPVVGLEGRVDEATPVGVGQPVGVDEDPQPVLPLPPPLVGDLAVGAQRHPQPGGQRDVPDRRAGAGQVEVDERDRLPVPEDDVVEVDVVVADEPVAEAGGDVGRPVVRRRVEAPDGVVEPPQQAGHAAEGIVGERPRLARLLGGGLPFHVAEDLPSRVVLAEVARRAVEAHPLEVLQQRVDRRAALGLGPVHRVADPHDEPGVGDAAGQRLLGRGGGHGGPPLRGRGRGSTPTASQSRASAATGCIRSGGPVPPSPRSARVCGDRAGDRRLW